MAITNQQQSDILKVVVGLFNAAPGGTYMTDLAAQVEAGTTIAQLADGLAANTVFTNGIMAGKVTTASQVAVLLNNFGLAAGNADPASAAAQAEFFFTTRIDDGVGIGAIVYEAVTFLSATTEPAFLETATLLANKALVAASYSASNSSSDLSVLQNVVDNVEGTAPYTAADVATVLASMNDTTAPVVTEPTANFSFAEGQGAAATLATVAATDNIAVSAFNIVSGNDSGFFAIDATGNITLTEAGLTSAANDFETAPNSFTLGVTAKDAANNVSAAVNVVLDVSDVDEVAPALSAQVIAGNKVILTFDEAFDAASIPAGTSFLVTESGTTNIAISAVTVSGQIVTLTLATTPTGTTTVSYTPPGTSPLQDAAGNDADAFSNKTLTIDTTAPTLSSSTPADNGTSIAIADNLVLTFSEAVQAGTGNIVITNAADATDTRTIAVTDTTQVTFSGSTVTINPTADLKESANYNVQIAATAVKDAAGNEYAGISNATALNFGTVAGADPTFTLTTGVDTGTSTLFSAPLAFNPGTGTQVNTLQTGDTLTGTASAADTLNASLNGGATPAISGVENINLSTFANNTLVANGITGSGITIKSNVTTGTAQTITGLAAGVKQGFLGDGTLTSALADATGTADVMDLTLSGTTLNAVYTNADVEKLNIASSGSSANTVTLTNWSSTTSANTSLITGTQDVELKMAGASPFSASFIDASSLVTSGKTLTLTATADQAGATTNAANFTGVGVIKELVRDTGTTTYTNYKSGLTLEFGLSNGTNHIATNLVATNAGLTGSSDVLNLKFTGTGGSGGVGGTTNAAGVETLNILATSTNTTPGTLTFVGTTTLTAGAIGKTATINIDATSNQAVTFTGAVTADAINATGFTKTLTVTTTASQMAITGGSASDSITIGAFASVINGGDGVDTISSLAATGTLAVTINGGNGADNITLGSTASGTATAGLAQETVVFGGSSTWGDTIANFETLNGGSDDILNFSVSQGFTAVKHGTTTLGNTLTYGEGAGTVGGANDTLFVSTTAAAGITTAALLQANGTYGFTGEVAGDHMVLVVVNSATTASIFDVVAGNADSLITTADTVTLIGTLTSIDAAAGDATTLANWAAGNFSFA